MSHVCQALCLGLTCVFPLNAQDSQIDAFQSVGVKPPTAPCLLSFSNMDFNYKILLFLLLSF